MKIAIHHRENSFSEEWIKHCEQNGISYKLVNSYGYDIIDQVKDCDIYMWHFHHTIAKDVLFAKHLIYSLETAGVTVFPDVKMAWHFDDKIGQKYLFEAVNAPTIPTYIFYSKADALEWVKTAEYPKVFKLRRGSGSSHVMLVPDRKKAVKLVRKAFGKGFSQYDAVPNLTERWRKYKAGQVNLKYLVKGVLRLAYPTDFSRIIGNERGYVYFQDFISNNKYDIRLNIVFGRCFGCIRYTRPDDFRASGSGLVSYEFEKIPDKAVKTAFSIAKDLKMETVAFDFVMSGGEPKIVEMSYGFGVDPDDFIYGYWNEKCEFIETEFNPYAWMVEGLIQKVHESRTRLN
jgi:glutathione synthase/RimK-type ligase-like ATP-grasp enzyme